MNWIMKWGYAQQRKIDIEVLWPSCMRHAHSKDQAKAAFAVHAYQDNAWLILGEDEIYRIIEAL